MNDWSLGSAGVRLRGFGVIWFRSWLYYFMALTLWLISHIFHIFICKMGIIKCSLENYCEDPWGKFVDESAGLIIGE